MKTILLLRHAKSDWAEGAQDDFDRPLASRGLEDAPRMGKLLLSFGAAPDLVLTSSARRARQTADLVAKKAGVSGPITREEALYAAPSARILYLLRHLPETVSRPLIVAHNPGIEEAATLLLCGRGRGSVRMPTAALLCLEVAINRWADLREGSAILCWYALPKLLKAVE